MGNNTKTTTRVIVNNTDVPNIDAIAHTLVEKGVELGKMGWCVRLYQHPTRLDLDIESFVDDDDCITYNLCWGE